MMTLENDPVVEIVEGVDELCRVCPDFSNERCSSPLGEEEEVRKWDAIILNNLGLLYGHKISVRELRTLIEQKAPLQFCRERCSWKERCNVFDLDDIKQNYKSSPEGRGLDHSLKGV